MSIVATISPRVRVFSSRAHGLMVISYRRNCGRKCLVCPFQFFDTPKSPQHVRMSRDEGRCPIAEAFVPERFLDEDGTLSDNDPMDFIFGFGRRICPGMPICL